MVEFVPPCHRGSMAFGVRRAGPRLVALARAEFPYRSPRGCVSPSLRRTVIVALTFVLAVACLSVSRGASAGSFVFNPDMLAHACTPEAEPLDQYREAKHIWLNTEPGPTGWFGG